MDEETEQSANEYISDMETLLQGHAGGRSAAVLDGLKRFEFQPSVTMDDLHTVGMDGSSGSLALIGPALREALAKVASNEKDLAIQQIRKQLDEIWQTDGNLYSLLTEKAQAANNVARTLSHKNEAYRSFEEATALVTQVRTRSDEVGAVLKHMKEVETEAASLLEAIRVKVSQSAGSKFEEELQARRESSNKASNCWLAASMLTVLLFLGVIAGIDHLESITDELPRLALAVSFGAFSSWFASRSAQTREDSRIQHELMVRSRIVRLAEGEEASNTFIVEQVRGGRWSLFSQHRDTGLKRWPSRSKVEATPPNA